MTRLFSTIKFKLVLYIFFFSYTGLVDYFIKIYCYSLCCCVGCCSVSINATNSNMFVSGSCDATARLWDTRVASRAVRTFYGHEGDVNSVKFFPDGNRFGTGSDDGTCRLFDIRTGHQLQVYPPHQQQQQNGDINTPNPSVNSIAFSKSGRLLFASYSNGDCFVWDTLLAEVRKFSFFLTLYKWDPHVKMLNLING